MRVELLSLDRSDEEAIDAYHHVDAAVRAADTPDLPSLTRTQTAAWIQHPRPTLALSCFLARLDGQAVATLAVELPTADNRHLAMVELGVHPDWRRRGIGRQLFDRAVAFAHEHGRRVLTGAYAEPLPGGLHRDPAPKAFAVAVGATPALLEVRRRLDMATVDTSEWRTRYEEALTQAKGYTVIWWAGAVPEDLLAGVGYLESRMGTDAPQGDLDVEPENFDADRIRATDEILRRRGSVQYHAGARDDATGQLVAWSTLLFEVDNETHAWQGTTIVDPDHRGHRLGLLVKLENLNRTLEVRPHLRRVDTWNAAENTHMIAINEAIGFRPVDVFVNWQHGGPATT